MNKYRYYWIKDNGAGADFIISSLNEGYKIISVVAVKDWVHYVLELVQEGEQVE